MQEFVLFRGVCKTKEYLDLPVDSPCVECQKRPNCLVHFAQRKLFEAQAGKAQKVPIIIECSVSRRPGSKRASKTSIKKVMKQAGIQDLCSNCPEHMVDVCSMNHELKDLKRIAEANGILVDIAIIACHEPLSARSLLHQTGKSR